MSYSNISPDDLVVSGRRAENDSDYEFLRRAGVAYKQALELARHIVVGQLPVFEGLVIALASRGHCLLAGGQGQAKTTLISTLAKLFGLEFRRISLTPDMAPQDIVLIETQQPDGLTYANVLLIEEINRAQPKTQMALLNAIEDEYITLEQARYPLPKPFFVVATETPIERDNMSPLTVSQLERFMMKLITGYPSFEEEFELVRHTATFPEHHIKSVLTSDELIRLQKLIPHTPVSDDVAEFAVNMIRKTRVEDQAETFEFMPQEVLWGASTRALQELIRAAQARAVLAGRSRTAKSDVRYVSKFVLRHRLVMQPNASLSSDEIIEQLD
jgi:MoxR-like ATPase